MSASTSRRVRVQPGVFILSLIVAVITGSAIGGQSLTVPLTLRGEIASPQQVCGTSASWELNGRLRADSLPGGLADGEPFTFDQDPPLLFADGGSLAFHNFSVVGDYASVQFLRITRDAPNGIAETWNRVSSRTIGGQIVSVFEPSWDAGALDALFASRRVGFDQPYAYLGAFQVPGSSTQRYIYVRIGIAGIPTSPVVRLDDQMQYASNVVNLVVPTFDDARVGGGMNGFDLVTAARLFYRYFGDSYDVLALTPRSTAIADFGAFHSNVQNSVTGLNISTFNQAARFGSGGTLQGIEVYSGATLTRYEDTDHEMAHQWGSDFDWTAIAGITRAGHQPAAHAPLWTGGDTLIGAVLLGDRRVATTSTGYAIEQTPAPAGYHPIELYSMGLLPASQVPDFDVFVNQGQFDPSTSVSPTIGTAVQGDIKPISIGDVIRVTGPRQGPTIASTWRRATLLISHDRLASQQEMDYWNFFAQRLADRNQASRSTYDHFVSFSRATNQAVTLKTAIMPTNQRPLDETLDTDTPTFGATDWRGVQFTSSVPSRFTVGQTVTLAGHVTATDRNDFDQILLGFWTVNGTASINFYGSISRSGDFSVPVRFTDTQRDAYSMAIYLFWPNASAQYPRSSASTVTVE